MTIFNCHVIVYVWFSSFLLGIGPEMNNNWNSYILKQVTWVTDFLLQKPKSSVNEPKQNNTGPLCLDALAWLLRDEQAIMSMCLGPLRKETTWNVVPSPALGTRSDPSEERQPRPRPWCVRSKQDCDLVVERSALLFWLLQAPVAWGHIWASPPEVSSQKRSCSCQQTLCPTEAVGCSVGRGAAKPLWQVPGTDQRESSYTKCIDLLLNRCERP